MKTISQKFEEFKKKYEPPPISTQIISKRQQRFRDLMSNKIDIEEDFLTGSYVKQTQIKPRKDIDIFIVLNPDYYNIDKINNPRKFLDFVLRKIRPMYPTSSIRVDGQAISIKFLADSTKFDIVPAYRSNTNNYLIPQNKSNTWIHCNPKQNIKNIAQLNDKLDKKLKPYIKMLKCWARVHNVPIKSIHLEFLVSYCFSQLSLQSRKNITTTYANALAYIFNQACLLLDYPIYDEVNERVDEYLSNGSQKENVWKKFLTASQNALMANHIEAKGNNLSSIQCWRKIFGGYF